MEYTVGMFRAFDNPDRIVRSGKKGVLDLIVFWPDGYCFFDGKTGKARFNENQLMFKDHMKKMCGRDVCFKLANVESGMEILKGLICAKN